MIHRLAPLACFAVLGATVVASASFLRPPSLPDRDAAESGRRIFEQRCALCHSTGEHAAQGPGLGGVLGRKSASMPFGYSRALRDANLTWDRATLDRFLAAPAQVVPRTTMPIAVPDDIERRALVDYLATLVAGDTSSPVAEVSASTPPAPPSLRVGRAAFGDYRGDGPGVRRHITIADLPPPYSTPSAQNGPNVVAPPPGAHPYVPAGFISGGPRQAGGPSRAACSRADPAGRSGRHRRSVPPARERRRRRPSRVDRRDRWNRVECGGRRRRRAVRRAGPPERARVAVSAGASRQYSGAGTLFTVKEREPPREYG